MDPLTIGLIARAAPAALRALAGLLPGKGGEVAGKLATVAEATQPLGEGARRQVIEHTIEEMTPDERRELLTLEVELKRIEREARGDELNAETARHAQAQETIRTEIREGSPFARDSRPWIARWSFVAGGAYGCGAELIAKLAALGGAAVSGADPAILAALFGPCVWYMTARTIDGFTRQGRTL
jgi:hypothetical protein